MILLIIFTISGWINSYRIWFYTEKTEGEKVNAVFFQSMYIFIIFALWKLILPATIIAISGGLPFVVIFLPTYLLSEKMIKLSKDYENEWDVIYVITFIVSVIIAFIFMGISMQHIVGDNPHTSQWFDYYWGDIPWIF